MWVFSNASNCFNDHKAIKYVTKWSSNLKVSSDIQCFAVSVSDYFLSNSVGIHFVKNVLLVPGINSSTVQLCKVPDEIDKVNLRERSSIFSVE